MFSFVQSPLTDDEITLLADKYACVENFRPLVNWAEFIAQTEPMLEPNLERRPNLGPAERTTPLQNKIRNSSQTRDDLTAIEEQEVGLYF